MSQNIFIYYLFCLVTQYLKYHPLQKYEECCLVSLPGLIHVNVKIHLKKHFIQSYSTLNLKMSVLKDQIIF